MLILNEILSKQRRTKKKLLSKDFNMNGYDFVIRSTNEGRGGVLYFKTYLRVESVEVLNNHEFNESVWLRIKLKGSDSLLVGSIYRSPSSSRENNIMLNHLLEEALDQNDTHLLIAGYFN